MNLYVNVFDDLSNNLSTNLNLIKTHPIIIQFNYNYKRIEGDLNKQNVLTYISLKRIFYHFKKSDYYQTLRPRTKKKTTFFYLKCLINYNGLFKLNYIESIDITINKKRIYKYHLLKGRELKNKNSTANTIINNNPIYQI